MEQKAVHTILEEDIYPNIDRFKLLKDLGPENKKNENGKWYVLCNCPVCGEKEAYLYNNNHIIYCNRKDKCGNSTSIWDYVKEHNGFTTQGEVLKYLADSAGYELPALGSEQMKNYDKMLKRANLLNDAQKYFQECLQKTEGQKSLQYLKEKRNYSDDVIHKMQPGHVTGYQETVHHLNSLGYTTDDIEKELKHLKEREGIHTVSIPLYDEKGYLKQIITRSIDDESKNKYLPLTTVAQTDLFVNIDRAYGNKDLIVVEGYFDALHLSAVGFDNAIGIRGSSITSAQLKVLKGMEVQRVFLCLDQDEAGIKGTLSSIKKLNEAGIEIFIISLPKQFKDPDQLLSECKDGPSQFKILKDAADSCGTWLGTHIPQKYDLSKENGKRDAIYEVSEWYKELNVLDKEALREASSKSLSIPEEHWKEVEVIAAEVKYEKDCADWVKQAQQLINEGRYNEIDQLQRPIDPKKSGATNIKFLNELDKNFLVDDPPKMPYLIGIREGQTTLPFIVRGIVGSVVALGGTGKTHYLTQLALSIATCQDFLHHYPVKEKGRVIYIYGENSCDDIHRLLHKTAKGLFSFPENAPVSEKEMKKDAVNNLGIMSVHGIDASFIDKEGEPTVFYQDFCRDLNNLANKSESGLSLVVIDPASRFLGAEAENNSALATKFIALLEAITQMKGNPTVLFAHHMNKGSITSESNQGSARGSSALTDGPRLQINLENVGQKGLMKFQVKQKMAKSNHTKIIDDASLEKDQDGCLKYADELSKSSSESKGNACNKKKGNKSINNSYVKDIQDC